MSEQGEASSSYQHEGWFSEPKNSMRDVWFFFKFVEGCLGLTCMVFHIQGFLYEKEPLPHQLYFCGTFFGFSIISIFGDIGLFYGAVTPLLIEAIIATSGFGFFVFSSMASMYHAEQDFHLMYLSDFEESIHPFFVVSRRQSISALACALVYLLHATFAFDALLITEKPSPSSDSLAAVNVAKGPIELTLFFRPFLERKFECCRKFFKRIDNVDNVKRMLAAQKKDRAKDKTLLITTGKQAIPTMSKTVTEV